MTNSGTVPNVEDIARELSVSSSMVYRVMNGRLNPGNKKHLAIRDVLRKTAYTKQRKRTKGNILCVTGIESPHAIKLAALAEEIVRNAEYEYLSIHSLDNDINSFVERFNIAGVLFISNIPTVELFVPTVILNKSDYSGRYSCVTSDEMVGLTKAFKHLRECGHERVAFFDDYSLSDYYPNPRRFFAPQAYATSGLEYDERLIHKTAFKPAEHAKPIAEAVEAFCSLRKPPTAIVLPGADYLAPFQEELRLKGIKSPEDVSFIVFDDISMDAALHVTTIRKPVNEMAEAAFNLLKEKIDFPHTPGVRILIEPALVERESVTVRGQDEVRS